MKSAITIDLKIVMSMLFGAVLILVPISVLSWLFLSAHLASNLTPDLAPNLTMTKTLNSSQPTSQLAYCEIFFNDDRDYFETEINKRLPESKLIQSNVIWSETTKQLGFYAMICY